MADRWWERLRSGSDVDLAAVPLREHRAPDSPQPAPRRSLCPRWMPMTTLQSLLLNPFQKWRRFGRFPWEFAVAMILLILTTTQVILDNTALSAYERSQLALWQNILNPSDSTSLEAVATGGLLTFHLYKLVELEDFVSHIVHTYHGIQNTSIDYYEYVYEYDKQAPVVMEVVSFAKGTDVFDPLYPLDSSLKTERYELNMTYFGPITDRLSVYSIVNMVVSFPLRNTYLSSHSNSCLRWNINTFFDFSHRGRMDVTVEPTSRLCDTELEQPWYSREIRVEILLLSSIAILAAISQVLHFYSIIVSFRALQDAERQLRDSRHTSWNKLPCNKKMRFFNLWFFVATIGNSCNIIGAISGIQFGITGKEINGLRLLFISIGCMMAWINVVQYFEFSLSYYVLILTLKKGTPRVLRFLIGVLPVFFGYCLFGFALFSSRSEKFGTVDNSAVTLFSLLNGDSIYDVFEELYPYHPLISRVYLYSFIMLFIYAVLNIFIAIIEDAFFAAKALSLRKVDPFEENNLINWVNAPPVPATPLMRREAQHQYAAVPNMAKTAVLLDPDELGEVVDEFKVSLLSEYDLWLEKVMVDIKAKCVEALTSGQSGIGFRPPHDAIFYPCGYHDCMFCHLRRLCEEASERIDRELGTLREFASPEDVFPSDSEESKDFSPHPDRSD